LIAATELTRQFGSRVVVDRVTFTVARGEIVALLGPNGAGKTTTLRMLAGLIAPTTGSVAIDGVPLTRASGGKLRTQIGFLTETPGLWDRLTVAENLRVYAGLYGLAEPDRAVNRALDLFELAHRASARTAELSKGLRQKVALARALLHDPVVLLLDEPTSGLDPQFTRSVRRLLDDRRTAGCAILVSTHNLDEAERLADRVAVLQQRLIALDPPAVLRRRLTTNRAIVRTAGDAAAYLPCARRFDPQATTDGSLLHVSLTNAERDSPELVRALVASGAAIVEVRQEMPDLEDVYLHLVDSKPAHTAARFE
jgi:ABC-2 type transport system ATP-binding protein